MTSFSSRSRADQRASLLDVARDTLEQAGPEALQARTLADKVGASTQAIYTLFGGMPGLFEQLVRDGFVSFAEHVSAVADSDDPVADFLTRGWTYCDWALAHPQLYRLMFGLTGGSLRQHAGLELSMSGALAKSPETQSAAQVLVSSLDRVKQAGRLGTTNTVLAAGQFLSATHGYVLLQMGEVFGDPAEGLRVVADLAINLLVAMGDQRDAAERSLATAVAGRPQD